VRDLVWLDALKGVAMLWILLNHVVEQLAGGEYLGNPGAGWPPLAERIAQVVRPAGDGLGGALLTAVRDVGWLGDQGVTLFLIASGFGLAYGLRRRGPERIDRAAFYRARAARIYPLWLGAHAVLLVVSVVTFAKLGPAFVLSALGVRFLPQTMYAFVPAWWYVGLLLQLYALAPFLWEALRRFGAARTLAAACALGFVSRALGLYAFGTYVDAWSRGAVFVTRLPEFVFGMCAALWYAADPDGAARFVRRPATLVAAAGVFALGFVCAFTLAGMTVAPFLMGTGAFALAAAGLAGGRRGGALASCGRNSYAIYLVHQPFVGILIPAGGAASAAATAGCVGAALAATAVAAPALEAGVAAAERGARAFFRHGIAGGAARTLLAALAAYALLLGLDRLALAAAPQEIYGWGERPSLVPDAAFGWKLAPSRTTRLRWTTYDYVVRANALGFPGPDVAPAKPPGTFRVLVTGDAFTSGEGVGTDAAWPALLQRDLARSGRRNIQVLNFAITGYGPDQELRVLRAEVPVFRPDVVILESFVNAFEKLGQDDDDIRRSIGFGNPPGNGIAATLRLYHLRAFALDVVALPLVERITGRPSVEDAGLADASAFRRDDPAEPGEAAAYRAHLAAARDTARAAGAAFVLVMIPSRSQVCAARDFPRGAFLDLGDPAYDRERPQREAAAAARALGIRFLDLRPALAGIPCGYQRGNMHFLVTGDERTAAAVAAALSPTPRGSARGARAGPRYPPG
jgi:peptidoglycan/LPS O-acetylase OafA/YrhL